MRPPCRLPERRQQTEVSDERDHPRGQKGRRGEADFHSLLLDICHMSGFTPFITVETQLKV